MHRDWVWGFREAGSACSIEREIGSSVHEARRLRLKVWAVPAIAFLQVLLFSAHWFLFHTLVSFLPISAAGAADLKAGLLAMSFSFIVAAMLGFRYANVLVALIYKVAALWLGVLNFFFWAACLCWLALAVTRVIAPATADSARPAIGTALFGLALLVCVYGVINARLIRQRRVTVTLPNLPAQWRGRTALVVSDLHLGNVNGVGFARRIAKIARRLNPSILFLAGDVYDGSRVDPVRLAAPLSSLEPPFGTYFCGGNHEEFGDSREYEGAIRGGGIRVLHNERVDVDGLQLIGVSFADSNYPAHMRTFLENLQLESGPASILLNHVPHRLPIVEEAGVSLQISGHTHGGQIFPFNFPTRWVYGKFTYGLQRFRKLQVLTSSGAGTWGPPMRVGTHPEVVLITFA
jgi:predicted MPP superfamily phosphohydrolase